MTQRESRITTKTKTGYNPSKTAITQEKVELKKDFGASIKSKTLEAKEDNKEKYKIKPQIKQAQVVGERVTTVIRNKKKEKKGGELVDNFQYYESKNLSKKNKESIVVHKRKGDPFYQLITNKRNANYNFSERNGATLEKNENRINTMETGTQRNQYQNKTYNITNVAKTTQERGNRNRNNNESSYQRTINVEEKRKNIPNKIHFEKTYTETNKRKTTNVEHNINVPVTSAVQNNKKTLDTKKNKINEDQSKPKQKKEEIQKKFVKRNRRKKRKRSFKKKKRKRRRL